VVVRGPVRPAVFLLFVSAISAVAAPAPARQQAGQKLYAAHCVMCHGPDGTGGSGPSLTGKLKHGKDVRSVSRVIKQGIPGTMMPPSSLPDSDIRQIATYVARLRPKK
jgi:mono/diheme cytochrome c family protein